MGDYIDTIDMEVELQENGIIRRKSDGHLIARLVDGEVYSELKEYEVENTPT